MAQDHHQPRAETLGGELYAANLRRGDDVAGDADDEQVSQALIEHDFRGHARIGASEDDSERILAQTSSARRLRLERPSTLATPAANLRFPSTRRARASFAETIMRSQADYPRKYK
jgi:hypothetical protein